MRLVQSGLPVVVAVLALTACSITTPPAAQAPTTRVVVAPAPATIVQSSPTPPPSPLSELVPPPPSTSKPTVWQPGHWRYSGIGNTPWTWEQGRYVAVPPGASAWVPGQWQQQMSGWVWREGHWA